MYDSREVAKSLFEPIGEEKFFSEYADRKFLQNPGDASKVERLLGYPFGPDELMLLLSRCAVEQPIEKATFPQEELNVQLNWYGPGGESRDGIRDQKLIFLSAEEGAAAIRQASPNAFAIFNANRYAPSLHDFTCAWEQAVRIIPQGQPQLVFFYRGDTGIGVAPHFDASDAYQIMLTGRKRWRVSAEPVVPFPHVSAYRSAGNTLSYATGGAAVLNPETSQPLDLDKVEWREFESGPGDVIYLPGGTIHTTEYEEPGTMGVSLLAGMQTRKTLMFWLLAYLDRADPSFWNAWVRGRLSPHGDSSLAPLMGPYIDETIRELGRTLREDVGADWLFRAVSPEKGSPTKGRQTPHIERATRLVRRNELSALEQTQDGLVLHVAEDRLVFDEPRMWGFARGLHRSFGEYPAEHACSWSDTEELYRWEEVQPLLSALVEEGYLEVVQSSPDAVFLR